jgi:hypothetical protein
MSAQKAATSAQRPVEAFSPTRELSLIQLNEPASPSFETPARSPAVAGYRLTALHAGLTRQFDGNSDWTPAGKAARGKKQANERA